MKPIFSRVADELKESNDYCTLASLDCTENPEMTEKYEISGFPTIKLFKNGKHIADYTGTRTAFNIKQFIKQHSNTKDEL